MDLVCRLATSREVPAGQIEIHSILRGFRLDGSKLRASAEQLRARQLQAEYWIVQGKESEVAEGIYLIKKLWRSTEDLLLSSVASALAVTTHAEREAGILLIDIGAACSDYVIYRGGRVLMTGVVAFGGDNIDIALAQTCDLTTCEAEQLKLAHGSAGCTDDHNNDSGDLALSKKPSELVRSSISKPLIHQLIASALRTMFLCVKHRHVSALTSLGIPAGVVLTGGTSNLSGINDVAAEVFGVSSRIGHPTTEHRFLNDPRYATVVGLVQMNNH